MMFTTQRDANFWLCVCDYGRVVKFDFFAMKKVIWPHVVNSDPTF